jgi:hypothetical protein
MKRTYLYQLYQYSKPSFWLVVGFIGCYTFFFIKKMDMTIFPHNSMFAAASQEDIHLYAVKLNDTIIPISDYLYWKKDFLESSVSGYARYIQNGNRVMLADYFSSGKNIPAVISRRLVPRQDAAGNWLLWLASFMGKNPGNNASLKLYRYAYDFSSGTAVLQDSTLIYSQKTKSFK